MGILYEHVFGQSAQHVVSAQKIGTNVGLAIFDEAYKVNVEGTTLYVNKKVTIVVSLYDKNGNALDSKTVEVHYKVDGGAEQKFTMVTNQTGRIPSHGGAETVFTLEKAGTYTFWSVFAGDAQYEGCAKALKFIVA